MITQEKITIQTEHHTNGKLWFRRYANASGRWHRDLADGPAMEYFHDNGQLYWREFRDNGMLTRPATEGPAHESFYANGLVKDREFFSNGKLHRPVADGPAVLRQDDGGRVTCKEFWVNGKRVEAKPDPADCIASQTIEIAGKKYKLVPA